MNYFEYLDKTQDVIDRLEILLMKLDIEIGSTINSNDDANVVLNNMIRANEICVDTYGHGTVDGVVIEIRKKDKLEKAILGSNDIVYFDYDIEYIF